MVVGWSVMGLLTAAGCSPVHIRWPWAQEKPAIAHAAKSNAVSESSPPAAPRATLGPIVLAAAEAPHESANPPDAGEVVSTAVARVNGEPILAQDLMEPLRGRLEEARRKLTPAEYQRLQEALLRQQLELLIDRQLLVQAARREFPPHVIQRIEAYADEEFRKQLEAERKRMGMGSVEELMQYLQRNGQSVARLKERNRQTFLAQQYVRSKIGPQISVTRREMLDYYRQHRDQFQRTPDVRWREILVSVARHGSREAALRKAHELAQRLRRGEDFATIARAESDGATAEQGGAWRWTPKDSYAVEAVDEALFELPVGQLSDPIEGPQGWHIILVEERRDGGVIPFEEAQEELERRLRARKTEELLNALVRRLRQEAHIVTVFDD
jgi:parvulin-like peptidyl-prolyl isomerase